MSDHDRGPYTPPSDRLSFDPREPVRASGPAPVTLIVSAVILLGVIGAVFLVYRHGVRHRGEAPATVGAPLAEMKTPAPPEATNAAPPGLVIDKTDNAGLPPAINMAAPTFAPPPEQPLPRNAIPAGAPATPAPVAPVSPAPPSLAPQPVASAAPPPPPPTQHPAAQHPTAKPAPTLTIASLTDAAMAQKPAKPAAAKPAPKPAETAAAAAPAAGAGWVQIGAFSSTALADKGWSDIAQLQPAAMAGKGRKVEPVSVNGKTLYRAYITGFATRDAATAFCGRLKAAGKSCLVK